MPLILPEGYEDLDRGSVRVVAARLDLEEMTGLLCGADRDEAGEAVSGGRGGTRRVVLPGGRAVYVRHYLRGGMMRFLSRDLYLARPARPLRELAVTHYARASGCPVPQVLAVCVEEAGMFYRGWMVTGELEGTRPLFDLFAIADESGRKRLLRAAGLAIRCLHDAGVYHPDLTGQNLLVDEDGEVWVIDFDRAWLGRPNVIRHADAARDRFWRSMVKLSAAVGTALDGEQRRWLEWGYRG